MKTKRKLSLNPCCCRSEESDGVLEKNGDQQKEGDNRKGRKKNLEGRRNLVHTCEANFGGHKSVSCFETVNGTTFDQKQTRYNSNNCYFFFSHSWPLLISYSYLILFGTGTKSTPTCDPLCAIKWHSGTLMHLFWTNLHISYF